MKQRSSERDNKPRNMLGSHLVRRRAGKFPPEPEGQGGPSAGSALTRSGPSDRCSFQLGTELTIQLSKNGARRYKICLLGTILSVKGDRLTQLYL